MSVNRSTGIAGGRLAIAGAHTRIVNLVLSDVIGDDLFVIASGPTVADPSTIDECLEILTRYACLDIVVGVGERSQSP